MLRQSGIFRYKSRALRTQPAPTRCLAVPRPQPCWAGVAFFVSERALETHLGNQDHAQLPRHSSSCIPEPFFQDQSLLLPVFGGGSRCGSHRRTSRAGAGGKGSAGSTPQKAPASPCRPPAWPQPWERGRNLAEREEKLGKPRLNTSPQLCVVSSRSVTTW